MCGNCGQLCFGVWPRSFSEHCFDQALTHQIRETTVGCRRMRIVVDSETEVDALFPEIPGVCTTYSPGPSSFMIDSERSGKCCGSAVLRRARKSASARESGWAGSCSPS